MLELQEVHQDGTSRVLTHGYLGAIHRNSMTTRLGDPVPLFTPVTYRIRTIPFDSWIASGSRIRLVMSGLPIDPVAPTVVGFVTGDGGLFDPVPAGNGFTATVSVDGRSSLELPIANDSCGLIQATNDANQAQPPPPELIPRCPD